MELQTTRLGRTELNASRLGLGGMYVIDHYHRSRADGIRMIHRALDLGVNLIDTASSYFESEEVIGEALAGRRADVIVATKSYMRTEKRFRAEYEASFKRLRTDWIDIFQLHHVQYPHELESVLEPGGLVDLLERERDRGRVRFIGITSHHPGVLADALRTGRFDTVQFPYNVIERDNFQPVLDVAQELDVGTLGMKPISGGRLTSVEACLRFCAAAGIDCTLAGCSSIEHVETDVAAMAGDLQLSDSDREAMRSEAEQLSDLFCRRCRYCEKVCSADIPIADVFRSHDYMVLNQNYARDEYARLRRHGDACKDCGQCEEICPYDLPVRDMLETAHGELKRNRLMDAAVKVFHATHTYDLIRRVYFRVRGPAALPEHRYLHQEDVRRRRRP
jgi:uncharacterized protein